MAAQGLEARGGSGEGAGRTGEGEGVEQVLQAARELVAAYRAKATAASHFERLARAVDALDGAAPGRAG